ncbi:MAG: TetM/TetW/TetO/TetS family tetracycline resistance ribosomal protection protein [Oscillospiraceae bacterium]|jgi:ribosomal protection tetracycline resistance protein|nr:TetM/TetW/TetO/TetS family tetracycline resistance ribosomal protection protein [Oscillospiraceae bacterium]
MSKAIRNIGVFAHVDAGKTTLTEQLLRHSGAIRAAGAVDHGTAHTDHLEVERRRGLSVRSTCAFLGWRDVRIVIIDTPGHADFAAEVERSMWALDGAVLLISAVEGVQPQTEVLFRALSAQKLPFIVFINKTDRENADSARAIADARAQLSDRIIDISDDDQIHALLADEDEAALEAYLEGKIYPRKELLARLAPLVAQGRAHPAWSGSALKDENIEPLLDAIVDYLPAPGGGEALSGVVFAIEHDKTLGRAAHVRLFSGSVRNRDALTLPVPGAIDGRTVQAKITQIRTIPLEGRGVDLGELGAGEIGALYGLGDVRVGQVIGDQALLPRRVAIGELSTPLLMVKITPDDPDKKTELKAALALLSAEDPLLLAEEYNRELHIRVMGAIQLEILKELIATRFGLSIEFGAPNVIYRETIRQSAVGFYAYTMPKPCWAVIKFQIDPLPRGSGIRYESVVPAREIMPRYQHQIEQALPLALSQGMLGWRVDDVKITLIGGEHHLIHTHPLDFIVATPVALLDGLSRGGSQLLEPILEMNLIAPEDAGGKLLGEIVAMRGEIASSERKGALLQVKALVPLKTSVNFSTRFAALTGGRGAMSVRLSGYKPCDEMITCPRRGVHPLDTAKYILAARSALEGGIFG